MTNVQRKYVNLQHADIAEQVATRWKVIAPFPSVKAASAYRKWLRYCHEVEQRRRSLAKSAKNRARLHHELNSWTVKRDRLKVPSKYLSWANITAFYDALAEREVRALSA